MSITEEMLEQIDNLSVEELRSLQELVTQKLHRKTTSNGIRNTKPKNVNNIRAVVAPRPTEEELEAELREFLGDDYEEAMAFDLSQLPTGGKSLSQIVNENREDRV